LNAPRRTGQKYVQIRTCHVELDCLASARKLEAAYVLSPDCLTIAAISSTEVVNSPLQSDFRFGIATGAKFAGQNEPSVSWFSGRESLGDNAVLPQKIDLR
jgi:hypothetical protein